MTLEYMLGSSSVKEKAELLCNKDFSLSFGKKVIFDYSGNKDSKELKGFVGYLDGGKRILHIYSTPPKINGDSTIGTTYPYELNRISYLRID